MNPIKIIYPYNEILPKKSAHDVYIFNNCSSLANQGFSSELICGKGSLDDNDLFQHFSTDISSFFTIKRLPIIRKNNPLKITWNHCFFYFCQKYIQRIRPNFVITSVLKQADFHFSRKLQNTQYVYEVHQLNWYPGQSHETNMLKERHILSLADVVVVTTEELKSILKKPPYALNNRIEIVPLAVQAQGLPYSLQSPLKLCYVGQLYQGQGIETLLRALSFVKDMHLKIIGGKAQEIENLQKIAKELGIFHRVEFCGFHPPSVIPSMIKDTHVFVAPFENQGRMPYVAHTKLFEYAHWGKPIVAPHLPIVTEHFKQGIITFKPNDLSSLIHALNQANNPLLLKKLQEEITLYSQAFSWHKRAEHYSSLLKSLI